MANNPLETVDITFPQQSMEINFVFCEHGRSKNLPDIFGELAAEADIIALETVAWSNEGAKLRQAVADGDREALRELSSLLPVSPYGGFWRKVHRNIFDTKAQLHYPEASENHPIANAYIAAAEREVMAIGMRNISSAPVPPANLTSMLAETLSAIAARDVYTLSHLFPDELPKQDEKIKYLGMFGLVHRGLADIVLRQAEAQERSDIEVISHESGGVNVEPYENYLSGIYPTAEDVVSYYGLRVVD